MVRLFVILVGIFLLWVLFASYFSKKIKIAITVVCLALCVALAMYDAYGTKARSNIVAVSQVSNCGVSGKHSYRSDFKVSVCWQNDASSGTVKRLGFEVLLQRCETSDNCQELGRVVREMMATIPAGEQVTLHETLRFEGVSPTTQGLVWSAKMLDVRAIP